MIEFRHVFKRYTNENEYILKDVNFTLPSKGFVSFIGESGSGKTTILNLISGLSKPTSGEILIDDNIIENFDEFRNNNISFIFQESKLFDNLSVLDNIKMNSREDFDIDKLLNSLDIVNLKNQNVSNLSGGEAQRVAIARALARSPKILIADEPTSNLDKENTNKILKILKEISNDILLIFVSHDTQLVKKFSDIIFFIKDGTIDQELTCLSEKENQVYHENQKHAYIGLGFKNITKFIKRNIKYKKKSFVLTSFMLIIAIFLLIVSFNILSFDIYPYQLKEKKAIASALIKNDSHFLNYKMIKNKNFQISNDYIEDLKKLTNINTGRVYCKDGYPLTLEYAKEYDNDGYYSYDISYLNIFDYKDEALYEKDNILGSIPKAETEVLIYSILADYFIKYGIKVSNDKYYYPNSYEEILAMDSINYGGSYLKIVGIIKEEIPNINYNDENELAIFNNDYMRHANYIYVNNLFFAYIEKFSNNSIHSSAINNLLLRIDDLNLNSPEDLIISKLEHKDLKYNEVIVPRYYQEQYNGSLVGKNISELLFDEYNPLFFSDYDSFKIVGISDDNTMYFNDKILEQIEIKNYFYGDIYSINRDYQNIYKLMYNLKADNLDLTYDTIYEKYIKSLVNKIQDYSDTILIITIVFMVLGILILVDYTLSTINIQLKDFSILKAFSIKTKEIKRIVNYEILSLLLIVFIFSSILSFLVFKLCNKVISIIARFNCDFMIFDVCNVIVLFIVIIIISMIVVSVFLKKIDKVNPIDLFRE